MPSNSLGVKADSFSRVLVISVGCKKLGLLNKMCVCVLTRLLTRLQHLFFTLVEWCTWREKVSQSVFISKRFTNQFSLIISRNFFFWVLCCFFDCPDVTSQWTWPVRCPAARGWWWCRLEAAANLLFSDGQQPNLQSTLFKVSSNGGRWWWSVCRGG